MTEKTIKWTDILKEKIEGIMEKYHSYGFMIERDFVWTVQKKLKEYIKHDAKLCGKYKVFNDFGIKKSLNKKAKRPQSADIVVVSVEEDTDIKKREYITVELAVEFKFEPLRTREDIFQKKLKQSVCDFKRIEEDTTRVEEYVKKKLAKEAVAVFIDEGSRFQKKINDSRSIKLHWKNPKTKINGYPEFGYLFYNKSQKTENKK
jgi:hypothetical protein